MHWLIWIVVALCLGLWSLLAWGVAWLLGLDPAWVGDLRPLVDKVPFAAVLDQWLPGWKPLSLALIDLTQTVLGWLGTSARWVLGLVWGAGALLLLGVGAVLSLIVGLMAKVPDPAEARARAVASTAATGR